MLTRSRTSWTLLLFGGLALGALVASGHLEYVASLVAVIALAVAIGTGRGVAVLLGWMGVYAALGDRLYIVSGFGGGSGRLLVGTMITAAIVPIVLLAEPAARRAVAGLLTRALPLAAFLLLGMVFPMLGVITGYAPRTLLSIVVPLASLGSLLLGVVVVRGERSYARAVPVLIAGVVWSNALVGLIQTLYWRGLTVPLAKVFIDWDANVAAAYGYNVVSGRAIGLYANPNTYGLLGAVCLMYAAFAPLKPSQRWLIAVPGMSVLLFSQSRGVLVAAVAAALAVLVTTGRRAVSPGERGRDAVTALVSLGAAAAFVVWLVRAVPTLGESLSQRVQSIVAVFTAGPGAEASLAARLGFWRAAGVLFASHPFGTLGPPETLLGMSIDNDYIRIGLQGGVLYLAVYVAVFVWLYLRGRRTGSPMLVHALVLVMAVSSITQPNSGYLAFVSVFWLLVGTWLPAMIGPGPPAPADVGTLVERNGT